MSIKAKSGVDRPDIVPLQLQPLDARVQGDRQHLRHFLEFEFCEDSTSSWEAAQETERTSSLHSQASGQNGVAQGMRKRRRKTVEKTLSSEAKDEDEDGESWGERRRAGGSITA